MYVCFNAHSQSLMLNYTFFIENEHYIFSDYFIPSVHIMSKV